MEVKTQTGQIKDKRVDSEKLEYMERKRKQAMVLTKEPFVVLSQRYLSTIPLAGAAAYRLKNGEEGIIINWDHYANGLGSENFSDCIDYEIEHEAEELWRTRGKSNVDPFGPDHYEAVKAAMERAYRERKLDRYLKLKTTQMETFRGLGDIKATEELDFYRKYAEELKGVTNK